MTEKKGGNCSHLNSTNDSHHYIQWGHSLSPHLDFADEGIRNSSVVAGGQLSVNLNIDQMHHFIKMVLQGNLAVKPVWLSKTTDYFVVANNISTGYLFSRKLKRLRGNGETLNNRLFMDCWPPWRAQPNNNKTIIIMEIHGQ